MKAVETKTEMTKKSGRTLDGVIVSTKMQKTVVVASVLDSRLQNVSLNCIAELFVLKVRAWEKAVNSSYGFLCRQWNFCPKKSYSNNSHQLNQ